MVKSASGIKLIIALTTYSESELRMEERLRNRGGGDIKGFSGIKRYHLNRNFSFRIRIVVIKKKKFQYNSHDVTTSATFYIYINIYFIFYKQK